MRTNVLFFSLTGKFSDYNLKGRGKITFLSNKAASEIEVHTQAESIVVTHVVIRL